MAGPTSPAHLFSAFNRLALQGFGGVLPVAQHELVERRGWMTREQFLELLSLSQVLPGPNIVNFAMIYGDRCFGAAGALAAVAGMLLLPLVIVLAATLLYAHWRDTPAVVGALRGMGAVAAGLVVATGVKLLGGLLRHPLGRPWCLVYIAGVALAVGWLRWPMAYVVLGMGGAAVLQVAARLRRDA